MDAKVVGALGLLAIGASFLIYDWIVTTRYNRAKAEEKANDR